MCREADHPLFAHVRAHLPAGRQGRDLGQSSVSRLPLGSDRVRVCYAKSHLYTLIQKNPVSLILGVGGADKKWKGNFWFCFAASINNILNWYIPQ